MAASGITRCVASVTMACMSSVASSTFTGLAAITTTSLAPLLSSSTRVVLAAPSSARWNATASVAAAVAKDSDEPIESAPVASRPKSPERKPFVFDDSTPSLPPPPLATNRSTRGGSMSHRGRAPSSSSTRGGHHRRNGPANTHPNASSIFDDTSSHAPRKYNNTNRRGGDMNGSGHHSSSYAKKRDDGGKQAPRAGPRASGHIGMSPEARQILHQDTEDWRHADMSTKKARRSSEDRGQIVRIPALIPTQVIQPLPGMPTVVPQLASNLRSSVLKQGVSLISEHDEYFKKIVQPHDVHFDVIPAFVTSSRDTALHQLALENDCRVIASTSSSSSLLSQIHFALHGFSPRDMSGFSDVFSGSSKRFTTSSIKPGFVVMRKRDGNVWGIDSIPQAEPRSNQILIDLGKTMERMLTMEPEDFKKALDKTSPTFVPTIKKEEKNELSNREPYTYLKAGSLLLRSQLDASDTKLQVGRQVFDLKTRAVLPIRLDVRNYQNYLAYKIVQEKGLFHSFERERYDMCRAAYLKYAYQCRIGQMGGVLVAYHNTQEIFGLEYIPLREMERVIYGGDEMNQRIADKSFNVSLTLYDLMMKLVASTIDDTKCAARLLVLPGEQSSSFKEGDSRTPSSLRIFVEMLPEEKDDPDRDLPWLERRSSVLRCDTLSDSDLITHLSALDLSTDGSLMDRRQRLEGALTKDNNAVAPNEYYEQLITAGCLKCYDLTFAVRNLPVSFLNATTIHKTDHGAPQVDYQWKEVSFPASVGAELYRRAVAPTDLDSKQGSKGRSSTASLIPMYPGEPTGQQRGRAAELSASSHPTTTVQAGVLITQNETEEGEESSSDEELSHVPPTAAPHTQNVVIVDGNTIVAGSSAATLPTPTAVAAAVADKPPVSAAPKSNAAQRKQRVKKLEPVHKKPHHQQRAATAATTTSATDGNVTPTAVNKPSAVASVIAALKTMPAHQTNPSPRSPSPSPPASSQPSSSSSVSRHPPKPFPSKPFKPAKRVLPSSPSPPPAAAATTAATPAAAAATTDDSNKFINKLFSASALQSIVLPMAMNGTHAVTRTKLVSAQPTDTTMGMTPRRTLMTSHVWYDAASSSSSSSSSSPAAGKRHVMPAPAAPLPFMATSDLQRLMANTSFLESMPSSLAEAEAASQWRARSIPAADMALAGDAAAPLASTRHDHHHHHHHHHHGSNSNASPFTVDDYDQDQTNSMLQRAFYAPPSKSSSTTAATTTAATPLVVEPVKKSKLRQLLEGELRSLMGDNHHKKE